MLTIANHRFIAARPQQSVAIATKQLQDLLKKLLQTAFVCLIGTVTVLKQMIALKHDVEYFNMTFCINHDKTSCH